ncbi:Kynureninase [Venustampulla echinocandica]|uniref:Kynureninase n=1 Tax=Venustampulla echinocandica TaxID=2656787 RepID=A0A370TI37_9HELO|nr:Kynureninase [Venustampulla echinocandica]RDL35020.1 Kynureninase [Venustampulla echinocandica]
MDADSSHVWSRAAAVALDAQDPLSNIRDQFLIPSQAQLKAGSLSEAESRDSSSPDASLSSSSSSSASASAVYLCGNSLGPQPRVVATRLQQHLSTWSSQGVFGHFKPLSESPLPTWVDADVKAAESIAPIVGAQAPEVAIMQTLTANLHFLMSAFYKPDVNGRHKIILETKAFPSDHFVAEAQIRHHNLDPSTSMVTISPPSPSEPILTTEHILSVIDEHASTTALLLLPGIQFYTGQLLNIPLITKHARSNGIFVLWDLAHAVGNVPLQLHDWNVDAAAWCSYKYLNGGPGTIGGLFVHERHTQGASAPNRLAGWWGSSKSTRFTMDNEFVPIPGARGFQLSNPSILDITALNASLEVFALAGGMGPIRAKSLRLTSYLEQLLVASPAFTQGRFQIITPRDPEQRGAQLSLKLKGGLLDVVMAELVARGVVVDERQPDVIRVAPAPLFNSFEDCWKFADAFANALNAAEK